MPAARAASATFGASAPRHPLDLAGLALDDPTPKVQ